MPTWSADDDFEAAAAQSFGHNGVAAGSVQNQTVEDRVLPLRMSKQVAHAAQVAFAFFADIPDEDDGRGKRELRDTQSRGNGQQSGRSGSVVGDSRAVEPAT